MSKARTDSGAKASAGGDTGTKHYVVYVPVEAYSVYEVKARSPEEAVLLVMDLADADEGEGRQARYAGLEEHGEYNPEQRPWVVYDSLKREYRFDQTPHGP